jgi:hypothetical protein
MKAISLGTAMAALAGLGWWTYQGAGLPRRLPSAIRAIMEAPTESQGWRVGECMLLVGQTEFQNCVDRDRRPLLAIWGDSTAGSLVPGLRDLQAVRAFGLAQFTVSSCEPLLTELVAPRCIEMNNKILSEIAAVHPDIILLEAIWYPTPEHVDALDHTIEKLKTIDGSARIVVMGRLPVWTGGLTYKIFRFYTGHFGSLPERLPAEDEASARKFDDYLRDHLASLGVAFISAQDAFCIPQVDCAVRVIGKDGRMHITTSDGLHLTEAGSAYLIQKLQEQLFSVPVDRNSR